MQINDTVCTLEMLTLAERYKLVEMRLSSSARQEEDIRDYSWLNTCRQNGRRNNEIDNGHGRELQTIYAE